MTAILGLWLVILCVFYFQVVTSYVQPGDSSVDLSIRSNGTVYFHITFEDWTGYWSSNTVLAAGGCRNQRFK